MTTQWFVTVGAVTALGMAFQIAQAFNVPLDRVFQYPGVAES